MALAVPVTEPTTADDYLVWEAAQPDRYEWLDGDLRLMVGGTLRHSVLTRRAGAALERLLGPRGCTVVGPDVKLRVSPTRYLYPDAFAVCGAPSLEVSIATTAHAIVEVLSPSTGDLDRGLKWRMYQTLPEVRLYCLIHQDQVRAETFARETADTVWTYRAVDGPEAAVPLPRALGGGTLALAELYAGLPIPPPEGSGPDAHGPDARGPDAPGPGETRSP